MSSGYPYVECLLGGLLQFAQAGVGRVGLVYAEIENGLVVVVYLAPFLDVAVFVEVS